MTAVATQNPTHTARFYTSTNADVPRALRHAACAASPHLPADIPSELRAKIVATFAVARQTMRTPSGYGLLRAGLLRHFATDEGLDSPRTTHQLLAAANRLETNFTPLHNHSGMLGGDPSAEKIKRLVPKMLEQAAEQFPHTDDPNINVADRATATSGSIGM